MRISTPAIKVYSGCTVERANEIVWKLRLGGCEPASQLISVVLFQDSNDLLTFRLGFDHGFEFIEDIVLVSPEQKASVEEFVEEYGFQSRIICHDLVAVRFYNTDDQQAFDAALGIASVH